jgi:glycosyltransferase 2 family protein
MARSRRSTRRRAPAGLKAQHRRRMAWLKRVAAVVVLGLAAFLIYRTLSGYSLGEIVQSVKAIPPLRLLFALAFAAGSYFCLSWFDWLAVRYAGKPLPYRQCALASFCSLSLGHNIGFAALSSGAIRYRFYSRFGLTPGEIAKVVIFCGVTVGFGMITLAGVALLLRSDLAAGMIGLTQPLALALGGVCLAVSAAYVITSALLRGARTLKIRNWSLPMPPWKFALAQIGVGSANYVCVAGCLHQTLSAVGDVPYLAVAAAYVIANTGALITHVPGGLGVVESVVMFLLPGAGVIGALVMFRVIYYLVPLCTGGALFALTEIYYRRQKKRSQT